MSIAEGADSTTSGRFTGGIDNVGFWTVDNAADALAVMQGQSNLIKQIPEPSAATLGLFGLGAVLLRRRRN